jgi:hypothetical protein
MANTLEYNTSRSNANFTLWDTWCVKSGAMSFYRYHLVYIMWTMPVTSATAERSFSVLRRLKTYVRTTMNNDRLSSLALMHIHRDFSVSHWIFTKSHIETLFSTFFKKFIIPYLFYFFCSLFFFQHADVHATACWRIGNYAPAMPCLMSEWLLFNANRAIFQLSWWE